MTVDAEPGPFRGRMLREYRALVLDAGNVGEQLDGPLTGRMLKEDAPLVSSTNGAGDDEFVPALKKPVKENQDTRLLLQLHVQQTQSSSKAMSGQVPRLSESRLGNLTRL